MPSFSKKSLSILSTCEQDIITLCEYLIKYVDFSVVYGYRPMSIQNALFLKGRKKKEGAAGDKRDDYYIENKDRVVTYRGFERKSSHNYLPSRAVDIIPYPTGWSDQNKIYEMAGAAKVIYQQLKAEGKIKSEFVFGSDWKNPADPNHIEIKL